MVYLRSSDTRTDFSFLTKIEKTRFSGLFLKSLNLPKPIFHISPPLNIPNDYLVLPSTYKNVKKLVMNVKKGEM